MMTWLVGALGLAGGAGAGWAVLSASFSRRLNRVATALIGQGPLTPRSDLPEEVAALAARLGADGPAPSAVALDQAGAMTVSAKGQRLGFTARQTICISQPGFVWQARFAPAGIVRAADYYALDGTGGLDVRVLGAVPMTGRGAAGPSLARAQLSRYLAELPWVPAAIRYNTALAWEVVDGETLKVSTGAGSVHAEARFHLDAEGYPARVVVPARYRQDKQREEAWRGTFSRFTGLGGQVVPAEASVQWDSDTAPYWHAHVTDWQAPMR